MIMVVVVVVVVYAQVCTSEVKSRHSYPPSQHHQPATSRVTAAGDKIYLLAIINFVPISYRARCFDDLVKCERRGDGRVRACIRAYNSVKV